MAEKTACPSCGAENYDTDQVCMSCGASLTEPAPQRPQHEAIEEPPAETPGPEPTVPEEPAAAKAGEVPPIAKAVMTSLGFAIVEMAILAFTGERKVGSVIGLQLGGIMPIFGFGLAYGVLRGLMIGFVIEQKRWSPGVALLLGLGIGFAVNGWVTPVLGAVAGFSIGMIIESALPPPEAPRTGRTHLPR